MAKKTTEKKAKKESVNTERILEDMKKLALNDALVKAEMTNTESLNAEEKKEDTPLEQPLVIEAEVNTVTEEAVDEKKENTPLEQPITTELDVSENSSEVNETTVPSDGESGNEEKASADENATVDLNDEPSVNEDEIKEEDFGKIVDEVKEEGTIETPKKEEEVKPKRRTYQEMFGHTWMGYGFGY